MRKLGGIALRLAGIAALCISVLPAIAQAETLWLNARMGKADPGLTVTYSSGFGSISVKSTDPGTTQWIYFPVVIGSDWEANSVELCYELSDANSYISQIRVTEMTTPNAASVVRDDGTDLTNTGPSCVTSSVFSHMPDGVLTVSVRFFFEDAVDEIILGGLGLNVTPPAVGIGDGPAVTGAMQLQNYPNPFASSTNIEFRVPEAGDVRVQIYNPAGRLVRSIVAGRLEPGTRRVVWDAKDDAGSRVPPGVYFHVVRVGSHVGTKRMVLAR